MGNKSGKSTIVIKEKIQIKQPNPEPHKKKGWCRSCFGAKNQRQVSQTSKIRQVQRNTSFVQDTRKSSIIVKSIPNIRIQDQLFAGKDKKLLQIRMRRAEPYQILKDSDYFDSQLDDRQDLHKIKKTYETCDIANYQTPQHERLQTVQVKTYLFDRNLTKLS